MQRIDFECNGELASKINAGFARALLSCVSASTLLQSVSTNKHCKISTRLEFNSPKLLSAENSTKDTKMN